MEDKSKQARVVERMLHIRDARAALNAKYEEQDRTLRTQYERGEAWLLNELHTTGAQSMKFAAVGATIYETTTMRASIADWPAFSRWVIDNDEPNMLQHRVSTTTLKAFMDQNENTPPPGVTTSPVRGLNIRQHRVSTTTLKAFMDQNENTPPPGVTTSPVRGINIRRT